MKNAEKIIGIIIIDLIFFWILVNYYFIEKFYSDPEFFSVRNMTIFVIIVNIIIFGIIHFIKKSKFKIAFFANIILAPIILQLVLTKANQKFLTYNFAGGNFKYQNTNYSVYIDMRKQNFLLTKTDLASNKTNIISGKIEMENEKIILKSELGKYTIENDTIKGIDGKNFRLR